MKTKITILLIFILLSACGSKKTISKSAKKEKTDVELIDSSKINKKIESEQLFVDTKVKERIVTMYGVRFDTIYSKGKPYIIPTSYPLKTEENRNISTQNLLWKLNVKDSIQKAVDLKYKSKLDEEEAKILELKESTQIYQIAALILAIAFLVLLIIYFVKK